MVGASYTSSTGDSPNFAEDDTGLTVRDLRRKTDDFPDCETTESSHQWTDEVESETLEKFQVLTDVEEILTSTSFSFMGKGKCRYVLAILAQTISCSKSHCFFVRVGDIGVDLWLPLPVFVFCFLVVWCVPTSFLLQCFPCE